MGYQAPPLPEYYGENMEFSVVIDRGDIWYDFPYDELGKRKAQPRSRYPHLTLFVHHLDQKIPLVHWRTTIGSWRNELKDGEVMLKYKNSDVGPRVWKDIVAAPVWIPPASTPPAELIKARWRRGKFVKDVSYDEIGPGYRSAYGLVAGYHIRQNKDAEGNVVSEFDNSIRTHGSVDYMSILRRFSHGCHRLYNMDAVRMFSFLLAHREYTRQGQQTVGVRRNIEHEERTYQMKIDTRGYKYELVEPIPVMVTTGNIKGRRKTPIEGYLPRPVPPSAADEIEIETERSGLLDEAFPEWGNAPYHSLRLRGRVRLSELLRHLTVLLPVLDDDKHYFVGRDEVEKLLARGEGWLATHPERDAIAKRYLKHRGALTREALLRLAEEETDDPDRRDEEARRDEETLERPITLDARRLDAVMAVLEETGARSVADLGCGEGKLLRRLLAAKQLERIVGLDVSMQALERASARLHLDEMAPRQRARLELLQGSITYRDARLEGLDAACLVEVIEHVEPSRLGALERVVFEHAAPRCVIVTTPNVEYNARFETLPAGKLRHRDHRFEWTRDEFRAWATTVADRHGYAVELRPVGPLDEQLGAPTQMGVFTR